MEAIEKLLALLSGYPTYVKGLAALWIALGATLIGLFIFVPRSESSDHVLFVSDINELWSPLMADIKGLSDPQEKRLTVLGLTLYAAWNELRPWIVDPETRGWTIELYCLDPNAAKTTYAHLLEPKWSVDAEARLKEINDFRRNRAADLTARQMSLSIHTYDSFPAVHGFALGSGLLYVSYTQWSDQTHLLDYGPHPYEVIRPKDHSVRAKAYRDLYYNWLNRAKQPLAAAP